MANADTVLKRMSLINYVMPCRGPMVAMRDENNLGETHAHVGTLQSLLTLYSGVMAITYRKGVDATDDTRVLGTLRSDAVSEGTQIYFVSLDNLLGIGEVANGAPAASSTNSTLTLSDVAETTAAMSTNDGTVVAPIGRAIEFRVSLGTTRFANVRAPILVQWPTDGSNTQNITVYLDIEWNK
jgi:hypothetical protein